MELFTIVQLRSVDEGCFPMAFTIFHNVAHPDDVISKISDPECTIAVASCNAAAAGFIALSKEEADYYCPLVQETLEHEARESGEEWLVDYTADNRLSVLPLEEAIARYAAWNEKMAEI